MRYEHWSDSENSHHLYYLKTKRWLKNLIDEWKREKFWEIELAPELANLETILDKLERSVFQIAVFGMVGRGKSSVLNALANEELFKTGALHGVTQSVESIELALETKTEADRNTNLAQPNQLTHSVSYSKILTSPNYTNAFFPQAAQQKQSQDLLRHIQFFDTPGIDEVDGKTQTALAYRLANQVDLILFVIAGDLNQVEYDAIAELKRRGKSLILVFNKIDQYPKLDRLAIYSKISDQRVKDLISPAEIVMVAAAPVELRGKIGEDGSIVRKQSKAKPRIDSLEQKIVEIVRQQGQPLTLLNHTVAAQKIHDQIIQRKISHLDFSARNLVLKLISLKAILISLNPVMSADLLIAITLDLGLVLALSSLYGVSLSSSGAFSVLSLITLGLGAIGAVDLLLNLALSHLLTTVDMLGFVQDYLPFFGSCLIDICQGTVAAVSGFVIGQVAKKQLEQSLSWANYQTQQTMQVMMSSLQSNSLIPKFKANSH